MSPLWIEIAIHYATCAGEFPRLEAPACREVVSTMIERSLLHRVDRGLGPEHRPTALLQDYVERLQAVPVVPLDPRLVLVEWADSLGAHPSWQELDEVRRTEPDLVVCSAGRLVVDSPDHLCVVPHFHEAHPATGTPEAGCGHMWIPRSAVRRVTDLRPDGG